MDHIKVFPPLTTVVTENTCGTLAVDATCTVLLKFSAPDKIGQLHLILGVCGKGGNICSTPNPANQLTVDMATIESLLITPANAIIDIDAQEQYLAIANFSNHVSADVTSSVIWHSSNTAIASISSGGETPGIAVGLSAGTTPVFATQGSVTSDSTGLTVQPLTLVSLTITPVNATIHVNATQQYQAIATYSDSSVADVTSSVTWHSSNTTVATIIVDGAMGGLATSVAPGSTTITATSGPITSNSAALNVNAPTLLSIAITPVSATIHANATEQYQAIGTYSDASTADITSTVTWNSSKTAVATITSGGATPGLALGHAPGGTVSISANVGAMTSNTATLHVVPITLVAIEISPVNATIDTNGTQQYQAIGRYSNGMTANITASVIWNSSNVGVATIVSEGVIAGLATGHTIGTTTIKAISGTISSNVATLQVNAPTLISIAIIPANATINIDDQQQYTAIGTYSDASTQDITRAATWHSSNSAIATIQNGGVTPGLALGISAGVSTITTSLGAVASNGATLTVNPLSLVSIAITPVNAATRVNGSQQYTAIGTYSDSSTQNITNSVTWHSSDTAVAEINTTGLATASIVGTTNITASAGPITSNVATLMVIAYEIYVPNFNSDTVSIINSATHTIITNVNVGNGPQAVAITPDGTEAYVANNLSDNVTVINTTTHAVTTTIAVGAGPIFIAITPDGTQAFVANNNTNTVSVINTATHMVTETVTVGNEPLDIAITPDGSKAYVTNNNSNSVTAINTATYVTTDIPVGTAPVGLVVTPNGKEVYVANEKSDTMSVINTATNTVNFTIDLGSRTDPGYPTVTPNGAKVYVADQTGGEVSVISTPTHSVLTTIPAIGGRPLYMVMMTNGSHTYVTDTRKEVVAINVATNTIVATIQLGTGTQPNYMAISGDDGELYVSEQGEDSVAVIDPATNTVITTVVTGNSPRFLAITP